MAVVETISHVTIVDRDEGMRLLDAAARKYLNMSGADFLRDWDAGKFVDPDQPEIMHVALLLPFVA